MADRTPQPARRLSNVDADLRMQSPPVPAASSTKIASPPSSGGGSARSSITPYRFSDLARFWRRKVAEREVQPQLQSQPQSQSQYPGSCGVQASAVPISGCGTAATGSDRSPNAATATSGTHTPEATSSSSSSLDILSPKALSFQERGDDQAVGPEINTPLPRSGLAPSSPSPHTSSSARLSTPSRRGSLGTFTSSTSIATPDTGRRSHRGGDASASPSDDMWSNESEMELALELVNHVPPVIADRLIDRLRAAEDSRNAAEERAAAAAVAAAAAGTQGTASSEPASIAALGGRRWRVFVTAAIVVAAAVAAAVFFFAVGRSPDVARPPVDSITEAEAPQKVEEAHDSSEVCYGSYGSVAATNKLAPLCEATLQEVRNETESLQRRREELAKGYSKVLQDMSSWLAFLQSMRDGPEDSERIIIDGGRAAPHPPNGLTRSEITAHCLEAARPGRESLEALLSESTASPRGRSAHPRGSGRDVWPTVPSGPRSQLLPALNARAAELREEIARMRGNSSLEAPRSLWGTTAELA